MSNKQKNILLSIVIPNWNGELLLKKCLKSIYRQTFNKFQVIVVDNGSTDGSIRLINSKYPKVKIIKNKKNLGFAKAVNQGINKSRSEYIFLLNNDTELDKNCIRILLNSIINKRNTTAIAPKILNYYKRSEIDSAGDIINTVGQAFNRGKNELKGKYCKPEEINLVTAGATIYRKSDLRIIGLFDEDYFAYGEDVDWSLRAKIKGFNFFYEPKAIVYHRSGSTSKRILNKVQYLQFRNMTLTIIKNFPVGLFLKRWRFFTIPLVHINTLIYMFLNGLSIEAVLADYWIIKNLVSIIKKRIKIQKGRIVSINYLDSIMENKKIRLWGILKNQKHL